MHFKFQEKLIHLYQFKLSIFLVVKKILEETKFYIWNGMGLKFMVRKETILATIKNGIFFPLGEPFCRLLVKQLSTTVNAFHRNL